MMKYLKRSSSTKATVKPSISIDKSQDTGSVMNRQDPDLIVENGLKNLPGKTQDLVYSSNQANASNNDKEKTLPPLPPPLIITTDSNSAHQTPSKNLPPSTKPKIFPYNHSSPPPNGTKKSKARPSIRPSTSASGAGIHMASKPFLHPNENSSKASENWTAPEDSDGAYIRRTYAHFDARGVRGDGLLEGKEWTRERGARAVWEVSEDGIEGQKLRTRRLSMPPTTQTFSLKDHSGENEALPHSAHASIHDGRLSPPGTNDKEGIPKPPVLAIQGSSTNDSTAADLTVPENVESVRISSRTSDSAIHSTDEGGRQILHPPFAASSSSLGSHSAESVLSPLHNDEKEERAAHHHANDDEIDLERNQLMKKIDRYGFFPRSESHSTGSNNRVRATILSESALSKIPKRRSLLPGSSLHPMSGRKKKGSKDSRHVSLKSQASNGSSDENEDEGVRWQEMQKVIQNRESKEIALSKREAIRSGKWDRMLHVRRDTNGRPFFLLAEGVYKSKKLKRRVYKGVPDRWRAAVWWALLQARLPNETVGKLEADFIQLQSQPSTHDVQIDLDVPRTISGHILFHTRYGQGQRALFHVLHAFSLLCDQCGYCQGMGPIVATLLVYFPPERAYAALVELHNDESFGIHQTFSPGFPGLVENFYVQRKIAMLLCPDVVEALEEKNIITSAYATKWYITLFTNVFPFATQLRLWDAFFLHGRDVLVITSLAILWSLRDTLLHGSFETCLSLLGREFIPIDDDTLMNWIYIVIQREDIRRAITIARKEWAQMVIQGNTPML